LKEISSGQKLWFPTGSGPESGEKTAAKAVIWSQPAEFAKWEDQLVVQVDLLVNATGGQDIEAVRKQHTELGKVCGGCHKTFREKED
jgi:cytochrome c556